MSLNRPQPEHIAGFRLAMLVEGGMGFAAVALARLFGVPLREQFGATQNDLIEGVMLGLVATLPMFVTLWWLLNTKWKPLVELRDLVEQMMRELFPRTSLFELAIIAALAGLGEELLFRGFLQTAIGMWTTPVVGLVVASLVFGALHSLSRLYFVLATVAGAYLGGLFLWSGDLTVPIGAHGLYDFLALVYLTRKRESEVSL